jgi:hypothetical protein
MNRKQLTLILALVVVIGGLGLWLQSRDQASYGTSMGRMGEKVLGDFDLNAVALIVIKQGTNELVLAKQDDTWGVQQRSGFPAAFNEVSELLRKLWDLKTVQTVQVGASSLDRLELTPPGSAGKSATLVELKDKDGKPIRSVLLGKKQTKAAPSPSPMGGDEGYPVGRYVMLEGKPEAVSLVAEPFSNAEPKAEQWLSKDFFKLEKPKTVAVVYTNATNSFKLLRETETGDWKLVDPAPGEVLDNSKATGVTSPLSWPSFEDVAKDLPVATTGLDTPTLVTVETFDGLTYVFKIGKPAGDTGSYLTLEVAGNFVKERVPGKDEKPEDKDKLDKEFKEKLEKLQEKLKTEQAFSKWIFQLPKWILDGVLKERHALMVDKKEEVKPATGAPGAAPALLQPMPVPEAPPGE